MGPFLGTRASVTSTFTLDGGRRSDSQGDTVATKPASAGALDGGRDRMRLSIQDRMTELGLSRGELVRITKLSPPTIRKVVRAEGGYDDATKYAICDALGWARDSIDRLLAGHSPIVLERWMAPTPSPVSESAGTILVPPEVLESLRQRVVLASSVAAGNAETLEAVLAALEDLRDEVRQLRRDLARGADLRHVAESMFDVSP